MKMIKKKNNRIRVHRMKVRRCTLIFFGTAITAIAIRSVLDPAGLVTGGFTGIAILIKEIAWINAGMDIPLWLTNLVLNVPLFALTLYLRGRKYLGMTFVSTMMLSVWLYLIPEFLFFEEDIFLTAIFGGFLFGIGIGLTLLSGATTGGTDLMAALIVTKYRHLSLVHVMQVIDGMIVLLGALVFGMNKALYAIAAIYVVTRVSDSILEGAKFAKGVYVITSQPERIAKAVMDNIQRGVTAIHARGMYTGEEKKMLFCVLSKKEIVPLKDLIHQIDPNAFVIVSDVREVLGEGFLSQNA